VKRLERLEFSQALEESYSDPKDIIQPSENKAA
jgi:hypothetical protein